MKELREYKYITSNLLVESGMQEKFITSKDLEKVIIDYIIANNIVYPSNSPVDGYVTKGVIKNDNDIIHAGINVASKIKDEVKSPLNGVVVVA